MTRSDPALSVEANLAAARARAAERERELAQAFEAVVESAQAANLDDEHDPEGATVGFERAQLSALLNDARARLSELDAARERLRAGDYGTCEGCGQPIAPARLAARPETRLCVQCAARPASAGA